MPLDIEGESAGLIGERLAEESSSRDTHLLTGKTAMITDLKNISNMAGHVKPDGLSKILCRMMCQRIIPVFYKLGIIFIVPMSSFLSISMP